MTQFPIYVNVAGETLVRAGSGATLRSDNGDDCCCPDCFYIFMLCPGEDGDDIEVDVRCKLIVPEPLPGAVYELNGLCYSYTGMTETTATRPIYETVGRVFATCMECIGTPPCFYVFDICPGLEGLPQISVPCENIQPPPMPGDVYLFIGIGCFTYSGVTEEVPSHTIIGNMPSQIDSCRDCLPPAGACVCTGVATPCDPIPPLVSAAYVVDFTSTMSGVVRTCMSVGIRQFEEAFGGSDICYLNLPFEPPIIECDGGVVPLAHSAGITGLRCVNCGEVNKCYRCDLGITMYEPAVGGGGWFPIGNISVVFRKYTDECPQSISFTIADVLSVSNDIDGSIDINDVAVTFFG